MLCVFNDTATTEIYTLSRHDALPISAEGFAFPEDSEWERELEESFPYQETPDQDAAIAAVKADMQSARPMDRLVCGDVGFGKTEVAVQIGRASCRERV